MTCVGAKRATQHHQDTEGGVVGGGGRPGLPEERQGLRSLIPPAPVISGCLVKERCRPLDPFESPLLQKLMELKIPVTPKTLIISSKNGITPCDALS